VIGASKTIAPTGTISLTGTGGIGTGTVSYSTVKNSKSGDLDLQGAVTFVPAYTDDYSGQYNGDTNFPNAQGSSGTVTVTGTDFALAATQSSFTVPRGGTSGFNLVVGLQTGAAPVTFTNSPCSGLPAESTCSVGQPSVTATNIEGLFITTTAPRPALAKRAEGRQRLLPGWSAGLGMSLIGLCLLGVGSRQRWHRGTLFLILLLALSLSGLSCGGGSNNGGGGGGGGGTGDPGTPTGSFVVTVTGTSGTVSHTTTFTLIVQ